MMKMLCLARGRKKRLKRMKRNENSTTIIESTTELLLLSLKRTMRGNSMSTGRFAEARIKIFRVRLIFQCQLFRIQAWSGTERRKMPWSVNASVFWIMIAWSCVLLINFRVSNLLFEEHEMKKKRRLNWKKTHAFCWFQKLSKL